MLIGKRTDCPFASRRSSHQTNALRMMKDVPRSEGMNGVAQPLGAVIDSLETIVSETKTGYG